MKAQRPSPIPPELGIAWRVAKTMAQARGQWDADGFRECFRTIAIYCEAARARLWDEAEVATGIEALSD